MHTHDSFDAPDALEAALRRAIEVEDKPSLLVLRSHIAYPSPTKTDDHEAHGYALKDDEIAATKAVMGLPEDETFHVPDDVAELYRSAIRASGRLLPPLRWLHGWQAATRFDGSSPPPSAWGMTWSTVSDTSGLACGRATDTFRVIARERK